MNSGTGTSDGVSISIKRERLINEEGRVAVIISRDFGSGWYSWHENLDLLFEPQLCEMILNRNTPEMIRAYVSRHYPDFNCEYFNFDSLSVAWLETGHEFLIHEYDGRESVWFKDDIKWIQS